MTREEVEVQKWREATRVEKRNEKTWVVRWTFLPPDLAPLDRRSSSQLRWILETRDACML